MFSIRFVVMLLALYSAFFTGHADAVQRAHVSAAFGSDSNTATNCTATAPCRFFQAAMSVTDINGEVIVLDSGGYGGVTITQSVALIAPTGVYAGISVFAGGYGVTIATPGVNVVLRGLTINGQGGISGINMTAGAKLTVESCVIANFTSYNGIVVNTAAIVRITDTTIRDNGNYGLWLQNGATATVTRSMISGNQSGGVVVHGTAGTTTTADIADSTMNGNVDGVSGFSSFSTAVVKISVRDSRLLHSDGYGLKAQSTAGSVTLSASNNIISNNSTGIGTLTGGKVWASGNTISGNLFGLINSGTFESAGNNAVRNNGTDINGTAVAVISTM